MARTPNRPVPKGRRAMSMPQWTTLACVELTSSDQRDAFRGDGREGPGVALELASQAESGCERHAVDVAAGARLRRVDVGMRIDPEDTPHPVRSGETRQRPERDRVIAAED